jgi:hypothetical protein
MENGDMLTLTEFLRRYDAMHDVKKAELIEGVVHMPSPVRIDQHAKPERDSNLRDHGCLDYTTRSNGDSAEHTRRY